MVNNQKENNQTLWFASFAFLSHLFLKKNKHIFYDVNICIMDDQLADVCFYAQFDKKVHSIYHVLDIITATNRLEYKMEGDKILLYIK